MADNTIRLSGFPLASGVAAGTKVYADTGNGEVAVTFEQILAYVAAQGGGGPLIVNSAPANTFGLDGQVALDPNAGIVYGPKAGGVWPTGQSFTLSADKIGELDAARDTAVSAAAGAATSAQTALVAGHGYDSTASALADANLAVGASFAAPLADGSFQAYIKTSATVATVLGLPFVTSAQLAAVYANLDQQLELMPITAKDLQPSLAALKGTVAKADYSVDIYFRKGQMSIRTKTAANTTRYIYTLADDTIFTLARNDVLLWDFAANTIYTQSYSAAKPTGGSAVLAYNEYGSIVSGLLIETLQNIAKDLIDFKLDVNPSFSDGIVTIGTDAISVDLHTRSIYCITNNGKVFQYFNIGGLPDAFSIPGNSLLVWDLVTNTVSVYDRYAYLPFPSMLLVYCRAGTYAESGKLIEQYNTWKVQSAVGTQGRYTHITFTGSGTGTPIPTQAGNVVTFNKHTMAAINYKGVSVKYLGASGYTGSFTFADNEVLIWNWDANTLQKLGNNDARPVEFIVLLMYKNGYFVDGEMLPLLLQGNTGSSVVDSSKVDISESRAFTVDNRASQGVNQVLDTVWMWYNSAADHSDNQSIYLYDSKYPYAQVGTMVHNFGHAAETDYAKATDTVLVSNAELTPTVYPRVDLILNGSTYGNGSHLDFNAMDTSQKVSINFFEQDADGDITKIIAGAQGASGGCVACFGEQPNIIYMLVGNPPDVYKIILGTGANDFSDSTGADLTKWGTFVSGKGDNEYNGTAKVIRKYVGPNYGTAQSWKFHAGVLYLGVTDTGGTLQVIEVTLRDNGTYTCGKKFQYSGYNADGTTNKSETEGACIIEGRYLLVTARRSGDLHQYWVVFPLGDDMGGSGVVGTPVTYPFACNGTPQPMITATSDTTDLYVSAFDRNGFTVSSKAGLAGAFNWSAKIC